MRFPIHEHGIFLHLLKFSFISLSKVFAISGERSCTFFVRYSPCHLKIITVVATSFPTFVLISLLALLNWLQIPVKYWIIRIELQEFSIHSVCRSLTNYMICNFFFLIQFFCFVFNLLIFFNAVINFTKLLNLSVKLSV